MLFESIYYLREGKYSYCSLDLTLYMLL